MLSQLSNSALEVFCVSTKIWNKHFKSSVSNSIVKARKNVNYKIMRKILNKYVVLSSYLDIQKQIFISE
jgi:hypothetical protein